MDIVTEKYCPRCKQNKNRIEFYRDKQRKDGLDSWCKQCCRDRAKQDNLKNPDKARKRAREYYRNNFEKMRNKSKEYWKNNPDKHVAYKEKHREKNKEDLRNKKIRIRSLVISHYGGKCAVCGNKNIKHLSMDHISGGGNSHRKEIKGSSIYAWIYRNNYPDGFQVLCHNHNLEKGFYGTMTKAEFENE